MSDQGLGKAERKLVESDVAEGENGLGVGASTLPFQSGKK